ncbi:MAG TPA: hypothetical protein VGD62_07295 [Acidobacteriaceae bacterium]
MKTLSYVSGAVALALAATLAPGAQAQTLQVLTAGSSAQFGPFAVAAYALAQAGGATAHHYTVKSGTCVSGSTSCYASLSDSRTLTENGTKYTIPQEPANLWIVWSNNGIWAYASVDSTVGVRSFQAYPRATLALASTLPLSSTSNYLFWSDGTPDTAPTPAVISALQGHALTAANTDIRPEDALFATNRALNTLGYGKVADPRSGHSGQFLIGNPIVSYFTGSTATPSSFSLTASSGSSNVYDPISGQLIPASAAFETLPVGAAPIVFLVNNASGAATTAAKNVTSANAASLFSGTDNCAGNLLDGLSSSVSLTPILREPLSGTMNTTEYSVFVPGGHSQETGVSATSNNPLHKPCGAAFRDRAVGTGDSVKAVQNGYAAGNSALATSNAVGYAFFSYESTGQNSGGTAPYRYITLNSVDPIATSYGTGTLPYCNTSAGYLKCPVAGGSSFPNLRNGSYKAWSIYRVVTDAAGAANATTLVNKAQALVNSQIPDFVPFNPQCRTTASGVSDPGLDVYREHYVPSTITTTPNTISITPNDGPRNTTNVSCTVGSPQSFPHLTLGGQIAGNPNVEMGGDVGGTIQGPFTASHLPTVPGPTEPQPH